MVQQQEEGELWPPARLTPSRSRVPPLFVTVGSMGITLLPVTSPDQPLHVPPRPTSPTTSQTFPHPSYQPLHVPHPPCSPTTSHPPQPAPRLVLQ